MDRVSEYREIISQVIRDYAAFDPGQQGVEAEVVASMMSRGITSCSIRAGTAGSAFTGA